MKKILCYGDSNTFGFNPKDGTRFDKSTRWTGILQDLLGDNFHVIEGGCNNRNCYEENSQSLEMNGDKVIFKYLKSIPDCVLLALGINDLQKQYGHSCEKIENGIVNLVKITKEKLPNAKIVIVAPARLDENVLKGYFSFQFDENSIEYSKKIQKIYKKVSEDLGVFYINLDEFAVVSKEDGLHFEPSEHKKIANRVFNLIKEILPNP